MSLPQPPKGVVAYATNGKAVCFAHHLRRCDRCCLDFSFGDSDEDGPYGPYDVDSDDNDEEEDERVFVLLGGTARFLPQADAQVLGPVDTYKIKIDDTNSPKPLPLSSLSTYYCHSCQLTWLVGMIGEAAVRGHPSHRSLSHVYSGTSRSILVFTDGACSGNGTPNAKGGIGVYFGPNSKFNIGERLMAATPTSQKAELAAAARALETCRSKIMTERKSIVKDSKGGHDPRVVADVTHLRVIVVTDSSYILEGMCSHFENWKDSKGVLVNKTGKVVENSEGFLRLNNEVRELSMVGVQVVYYHVSREENQEADRLAKGSIA